MNNLHWTMYSIGQLWQFCMVLLFFCLTALCCSGVERADINQAGFLPNLAPVNPDGWGVLVSNWNPDLPKLNLLTYRSPMLVLFQWPLCDLTYPMVLWAVGQQIGPKQSGEDRPLLSTQPTAQRAGEHTPRDSTAFMSLEKPSQKAFCFLGHPRSSYEWHVSVDG